MSRKRWIWAGALVVVAALLGSGGLWVRDTAAYANMAAGYAAQQTCACLSVSGRTLASCTAEFPQDKIKYFDFDATTERVRVTALNGVFKAEARYDERYGCKLVD